MPLHNDPIIMQPAVEVREAAEPVDVEWETIDLDTNKFLPDDNDVDVTGKFVEGVRGMRDAHARGQRALSGGVLSQISLTEEWQGQLTVMAIALLLLGGAAYAYVNFGKKAS